MLQKLLFAGVYSPARVAYEAQNNHRIDFYRKDQKIGWEVIRWF